MKRIEKVFWVLSICVIAAILLGGNATHIVHSEQPEVRAEKTESKNVAISNKNVEERLASMSLEEMVYQMFIVLPEDITGGSTVTKVDNTFREQLKKYPVGGIIYMASNLKNPKQTATMLSKTAEFAKEDSGIPIFLCVDEEGGTVARIANQEAFGVKNVGSMCDIKTTKEAFAAGQTMGDYLSELGFNFDFAPVADVLTNEGNQVVKKRSFGSDPDEVTELATAVSQGLQSEGMKTCFKHFPGHGATEGDTHEGFAYTNKTYEELMQSELIPFASAEEAGVSSIMVAHISVPAITGSNVPSSLSYEVVTGILREDLGYNGLVITDAMNMGAITENYDTKTATVMAVQAGVDLILVPEDFEAAVEALLDAVRDGTISRERIEESVRRILILKEFL